MDYMLCYVLAAVLIFSAGTAVSAQQQEINSTKREQLFENDHVRVWKSIILPNQPLALHRHDYGRTLVMLKGGDLDVVDATGTTTKKLVLETGKAYWFDADAPGTQHGDINKGKEPIEVIIIEMKRRRCTCNR
jgi:hypothetical protein